MFWRTAKDRHIDWLEAEVLRLQRENAELLTRILSAATAKPTLLPANPPARDVTAARPRDMRGILRNLEAQSFARVQPKSGVSDVPLEMAEQRVASKNGNE